MLPPSFRSRLVTLRLACLGYLCSSVWRGVGWFSRSFWGATYLGVPGLSASSRQIFVDSREVSGFLGTKYRAGTQHISWLHLSPNASLFTEMLSLTSPLGQIHHKQEKLLCSHSLLSMLGIREKWNRTLVFQKLRGYLSLKSHFKCHLFNCPLNFTLVTF